MSSKNVMIGAVLALVVSMVFIGCVSFDDQNDSDAAGVTATYTVQAGVYSEITMYDWDCTRSWIHPFNPNNYSGYASSWTGLTMSMDGTTLKGTPSTAGTWTLPALSEGNTAGSKSYCVLTVTEAVTYYDVTYNAGIGTINGSSTYTESIQQNSFASLPSASYSTGAYTFKGWATSSTSTTVVSSYTVTSNTTLYAVWTQNSVSISSYSATVSSGQSFSNTFSTSPSGATVTITSNGGLSGLSLSGKTLSGTLTNVAAGTYYVTLKASYTGYISATTTVTIKVPVIITQPIEYTLVSGATFSYEPVTDPSSATVTVSSVTLNGSSMFDHGLTVSGRTITGQLTTVGTYAITFNVSASEYVSTSKTVYVSVQEVTQESNPATISGINASARAGSARSYDFVAVGLANVVGYEWSYNGTVFSSSSSTSVYQFLTAGIYTVRCTVTGADLSTAYAECTVVCTDVYYTGCAWSGVEYCNIIPVSSTPTVTVSGPFSYEIKTVSGSQYLVISGSPSVSDVGNSYDITYGSTTYSITVYSGQTDAPISDFTYVYSEDGLTLTVTFTGSNASFVLWDYENNGTFVSDLTHTYSDAGYYTVNCKAVNNISERTSSQALTVAVVSSVTTSLEDLTDFYILVSEKLDLDLDLVSGDVITLSGSAAEFCSVTGDDSSIISIRPTSVGEYELTVTVTHSDSTQDFKTVKVTVQDSEDEAASNWGLYLILIVIVLGVGYLLLSGGKKTTSHRRR